MWLRVHLSLSWGNIQIGWGVPPVCFHSILCIFFLNLFRVSCGSNAPLVFVSWRTKKRVFYVTFVQLSKSGYYLTYIIQTSPTVPIMSFITKEKQCFLPRIQSRIACCAYFSCLLVLKVICKISHNLGCLVFSYH